MLTQRETDIAIVEVQLEIQKLLEEWLVDYLGNRYGDNRGQALSPEGAQAGGAGRAFPANEGGGSPQANY